MTLRDKAHIAPMRHEPGKKAGPAVERQLPPNILGAARDPIRPPWSWDEADFVAACTRCDACAKACPTGIIVRGSDGLPQIDFTRGECTFCGECVASCHPGALVRAHQGSTPWLLKAAITQGCLAFRKISCYSCSDSCSRRAIRFRLRGGGIPVPEVDRRSCKGCGACLAWCSVSAITLNSAARTKPRGRTAGTARPR